MRGCSTSLLPCKIGSDAKIAFKIAGFAHNADTLEQYLRINDRRCRLFLKLCTMELKCVPYGSQSLTCKDLDSEFLVCIQSVCRYCRHRPALLLNRIKSLFIIARASMIHYFLYRWYLCYDMIYMTIISFQWNSLFSIIENTFVLNLFKLEALKDTTLCCHWHGLHFDCTLLSGPN